MSGLSGSYAELEGTRFYYEEIGDPDQQTVMLLHTAGGDGRQWRYVASSLAALEYHVVVPDLAGHGKSYPKPEGPNTTIEAHAGDIWQLIDHLVIDRPLIGGCSVGGDVALSLAIDYSEALSGVVVMEGAGRTRGAQLGRLSHPHALPSWEHVLEYSVVDAVGPRCTEQSRAELAWQHRGAHEIGTSDLQAWADFDRMAELQEARCPVMLLRGAEDYFIQDDVYTETIEALPDVEHLILEDVGHYPMMEIPDRITELIHEFD